jgi:hypothetical protein
MAIIEGIENNRSETWQPVISRNFEDDNCDCVCRLQALVAELLLKNQLLRRQLRRDACTFES